MQARYVRTKLTLTALTDVSSNTAAFTLLLPGTAGVSLHTKGTDPALRGKLERELERLAVELDLAGLTVGGCVYG